MEQLTAEQSNEELFWEAFSNFSNPDEVAELGLKLDSVVEQLELKKHLDTYLNVIEEAEYQALVKAVIRIDELYGTMTGYTRLHTAYDVEPCPYDGPEVH